MNERIRLRLGAKKKERSVDDMFIVVTQEEEDYRNLQNTKIEEHVNNLMNNGNVRCTACNESATIFHAHPALRVLLCNGCNCKYDEVEFTKSSDGSFNNCMWCAKPVMEVRCHFCTCTFCEVCIIKKYIFIFKVIVCNLFQKCLEINFDADFMKDKWKWECLICNPKHLWWLRAVCDKFMYYNDKR